VALAAIGAAFFVGAAARGDDHLEEIVRSVAAHERLYENIELVIEERHRWVGPSDAPGYRRGMPTLARDGEARYVYQEGRVYHHQHRSSTNFAKQERPGTSSQDALNLGSARDTSRQEVTAATYTLGYDGERTVCVDRSTANVHLGRFVPRKLVRPHSMIFLGEPFVMMPFSEYLTAPKVAGYDHELVYEGEEERDGLNCIRLRSNTVYDKNADPDFGIFWIAVDRNYLPIREEFFAPAYSRTIPLGVLLLSDLREIAPGVWLPFAQKRVKNGEIEASEGKTVVHSVTEHTVTKASLEPQYDLSLFRDIPIPDGMPVIEIKEGEKVRDYVQGHTSPPAARWSWRWLLVIAAVGVGVCLLWKRRHQLSSGWRT
jgi:hypothetical protein